MFSLSYEGLTLLFMTVFVNIVVIVSFELILKYIKRSKEKSRCKTLYQNKPNYEPRLGKYCTLLCEVYNAVEKCWHSEEYIERAKHLLDFNPSIINAPLMPHGYTPFLRACLNGCTELVLYMLSKGADVHKCSIYGDSPFYLATYAMATRKILNFHILDVLIQEGCSVNSERYNGYTALHLAIYFKHYQLMMWLLKHGADPHIQKLKSLPYKANHFDHLNKKLPSIKNENKANEYEIKNTI